MKVVYVDVLFFINLCMDFLSLYIAGGVIHLTRNRTWLLIAGAIGAIYAIVNALFRGGALFGTVIGVGVSILLCYVAYGRVATGRRFWYVCILFYGVSWLLGGMITAFYGFLHRFFQKREDLYTVLTEGDGRLAFFLAIATVAGLLIVFLKRQLLFVGQERTVQVTMRVGNVWHTVSALVDSGNLLQDPLSGRPCIVLHPRAAVSILPYDVMRFWRDGGKDPKKLGGLAARRIRLIPAETVGGRDLLVGYLPDAVLVGENGGRPVDALLVLGKDGGQYAGHDALVPTVLV